LCVSKFLNCRVPIPTACLGGSTRDATLVEEAEMTKRLQKRMFADYSCQLLQGESLSAGNQSVSVDGHGRVDLDNFCSDSFQFNRLSENDLRIRDYIGFVSL
jgi:hypothetical protein